MHQERESVEGVVTEALPNAFFRISIQKGGVESIMLAYLAGKMRMNRIRVLVGDKVRVEIEPYGGKGRIIQRL